MSKSNDIPAGRLSKRFHEQYQRDENERLFVTNPPFPRNMMVELSNACNHACLFCTNPNMTRKISRIESGLLDRIMGEAREGGVEEIGFYTTGEPFVHKQLSAFTAQASDLGFRYIYISTNGAMASPDRAKAVIDAGMNSIKFSINAGSRDTYQLVHGHDDWDEVMANLQFISDYRKTLDRPLDLYVTFIVTHHTEHEIDEFRDAVGPLVDEIVFHPVHNQSGQMSDTQDKLKAARPMNNFKADNMCKMPFNRLHVTCEGYLTLCCVDYQNYLAVADLKEMSLHEAWQLPAFQELRQRHLDADLRGTLCGNCWYGYRDSVEPLCANLATHLDFPEFYRETADAITDRVDSRTADADTTSD